MPLRWMAALVAWWTVAAAQQEPGMGFPLQVFRLPPSVASLLPQGYAPGHVRPLAAHRMVIPEVSREHAVADKRTLLWNSALGVPLPPHDTAEVQAARDHHLQRVREALLQHALAHDRLQWPPGHGVASGADAVSEGDADSLVVESDGHVEPPLADDAEGEELTRYPDLQQVPQALFDPSHVHDAHLEAVIVDASPARRARRARQTNPEGWKQTLPVKEPSKSASGVNTQYTSWSSVPMYIEVKPIEDEPQGKSQIQQQESASASYSQKAVFANAKLPAAVHSFQVPPSTRTEYAVAPLPLFLTPHDVTQPLSYSAKANYFHSIPVAAVHDTQVHPSQVGRFVDHQHQPVFHQLPSSLH